MNRPFELKQMAMLLTLNFGLLTFSLSTNAENSTTTDSELESPAAINYNAAFFNSITYRWTDAKNIEHTSTLAEEASGWNQIQMFINKILVDRTIPGLVNDPTPEDLLPSNGHILCGNNDGTNTDNKRRYNSSTVVQVDWTATDTDWGITESTDRTPYEDALTAVLVKLRSDYNKDKLSTSNSVQQLVTDNIESMQVMTNRLRIDNEDNPGWLFNVRTPMNKFFIMTKGKLRSTWAGPLNGLFEQYSPATDAYLPENVYNEMLGNKTFEILHDCKSAVTQYHPVMMGAKSNTKDYTSSIMIFIPDRRFSKLTQDQCDSYDEESGRYYLINTQNYSNPKRYEGEDWTRDGNTSFIFYNPSYRPTMMFNTVDLYADNVLLHSENENVPYGYAWVTLRWHSNISKFLKGTDIREKFQLFRVVNGKKKAVTPTTDDSAETSDAIRDILAINPDLDVVTAEDGAIFLYHISRVTGWVTVYVLEQRQHDGRQVEYIVEGTIDGSEVSDVESNTVKVTIPGQAVLERCELDIIDTATSLFVYQNDADGNEADYNHYVHKIGLTNHDYSHYPLRVGHIKQDFPEDYTENTRFTLCQSYDINDISLGVDDAQHVDNTEILKHKNILALQRTYITAKEDRDDGYTYFKGLTVDLHTKDVLDESYVFKALTADGENAILIGLGDEKALWFTLTFDAATKNNEHPMQYCYRVYSNIEVTTDESDDTDFACSNIISIDIPHTQIDTSFSGYTLDEIQGDTNRTLPLSEKQIVYRAIDDVNVASYTIAHNGITPLAIVRRTQDGTYEQALYTDEEVAMTADVDDEDAETPTPVEIGEVRFNVVPTASQAGGDVVCQISDFDGNTYGSGRADIPDDIALEGKINSLDRFFNSQYFLMFAEAQVGDTEDNQLYLIANNQFNAWTISGDGTSAASADDDLWYDNPNMVNILKLADMISNPAATSDDIDYKKDNHWLTDNTLSFTHAFDYPAWTVGRNTGNGEKPFVADIILRYYPEIIPVAVYDAYEDYTNNPTTSARRKTASSTTLYAITEIPMTFTTYGETTTGLDDLNDDAIPAEYFNLQGIKVLRPESGNIYIRRQGATVTKVLIK